MIQLLVEWKEQEVTLILAAGGHCSLSAAGLVSGPLSAGGCRHPQISVSKTPTVLTVCELLGPNYFKYYIQ